MQHTQQTNAARGRFYLTVALSIPQVERLEALAAQQGVSRHHVARGVLVDFIDRPRPQNASRPAGQPGVTEIANVGGDGAGTS